MFVQAQESNLLNYWLFVSYYELLKGDFQFWCLRLVFAFDSILARNRGDNLVFCLYSLVLEETIMCLLITFWCPVIQWTKAAVRNFIFSWFFIRQFFLLSFSLLKLRIYSAPPPS